MTVKQMDAAVQAYCREQNECDNCRIKYLCEPIRGQFESNPNTLKVAYECVGVVPENYCCDGCLHEACELTDYPCTNCKANTLRSDPNYDTMPYLWTKREQTKEETLDHPVTNPPHYTQGKIQCLDAMESAFGKEQVAIWCKLNAFKYIWREEHKNGMEDIDKAIFYLNKFKELKGFG